MHLLFYWRALDARTTLKTGYTWAHDSDAVARALLTVQLIPISITLSCWMLCYPLAWWQVWSRMQRRGELSRSSLVFFFRTLCGLLDGGLVFHQALAVMTQSIHERACRSAAAVVLHFLQQGFSVGDAFAHTQERWPQVIPVVFAAAARSGALRDVCAHIADVFARDVQYRQEAAKVMVLPLITAVSACMVLGAAGYFCITQLGTPAPESALYGVLRVLRWCARYGIYVIVAGVIAAGACWHACALSQKIATIRDHLMLRIPFFGSVIASSHAIFFFTLLRLLLQAGVPLVVALATLERTYTHQWWKQALRGIHGALMRGSDIGTAFAAASSLCIPPLFVATLMVVQNNQTLASVAGSTATLLAAERARRMTLLVALIHPLVMLFIACIVVAFLSLLYQTFFSSLQLQLG